MPTTILGGGQVASCCWWRSTLNINTQPIGWFDASRCSPKFWFSNPSFQNLLPSEHWKLKQTMGNTLRPKTCFLLDITWCCFRAFLGQISQVPQLPWMSSGFRKLTRDRSTFWFLLNSLFQRFLAGAWRWSLCCVTAYIVTVLTLGDLVIQYGSTATFQPLQLSSFQISILSQLLARDMETMGLLANPSQIGQGGVSWVLLSDGF